MAHRPFFTPDYIAHLQSRVEGEVDRLLDNMEAIAKKNDGKVDMVTNFSEWLPMYTLCEMLGIDEKDRHKIVRWMHYLENAQYIVSNPERQGQPLVCHEVSLEHQTNVQLWAKSAGKTGAKTRAMIS